VKHLLVPFLETADETPSGSPLPKGRTQKPPFVKGAARSAGGFSPKQSRRAIFAGTIFLLLSLVSTASVSQAVPTNGDFANGLVGWSTVGDVTTNNQEVVLGDNGATDSLLYQALALAPGQYNLEFDYLNGLSSVLPNLGFLDTFFASLYFINDVNQLDILGGGFDAFTPLFDLDANGVTNLTGSVGASSKGGNWQHYSLTFQNSFNYVVPAFELLEQNQVNADSTVRIDNVTIDAASVVIPEPGTLLLVASGLLFIGRMVRRRS
jgi:hypothetical protein